YVKEGVKDLMIGRQWFDFLLGKNLVHLFLKIFPYAPSPEIVQVEEAAAQQVFADARRFLIIEIHAAGLHRINEWILEKVRIHRRENIGIRADMHSCQAMNAAHELTIAARIVRSPAPSLRREKILAAEFRTNILRWNRHRRGSETAEPSVIVAAAARWVF